MARPGRVRQTVTATLVFGMTLGGCAGDTPATSSPPSSQPAAITQVLTFQAFDDVGLLPHLSRAATVAGACQGGSVVHPGRADAWRCRSADTAYDPCFANATGEELACVADPWARQVTTLRPAAPLGRAGSNRNDPGLPPWFVELGDGTRCGRTLLAGYRCDTGVAVDEPDTTRPVWTVRPTAGAGLVSGQVRTAWY